VAVEGETVAVNVMAVPATGESVDTESVVVLAVVPVEVDVPVGACQKSPQPVRHAIAAMPRTTKAVAPRTAIDFTQDPFVLPADQSF
jgi:hypothetical protein